MTLLGKNHEEHRPPFVWCCDSEGCTMTVDEVLAVPVLWSVRSASGAIAARPGTPAENEAFAEALIRKTFNLKSREPLRVTLGEDRVTTI